MQKRLEVLPEHVIAYAYPTSENAMRHGRGKHGCYTLTAPKLDTAFPTLNQAAQAASQLRTVPGRWSIDHHLNSRAT